MSGRIAHIATSSPQHAYRQMELLPYMLEVHGGDPVLERQLGLLYGRGGIERRHSVLPDFFPGQEAVLYKGKGSPSLDRRLEVFKNEALGLAKEAAEKCMEGHCEPSQVTHLVTVSCTGLFAPGLEFQLLEALGLDRNVSRHPINFVGCYAAVPALNLANLICHNDPSARVLVVAVELCSLHFQVDSSRDNLMANALFADGAAACLVVGSEVESPADFRIGKQYGEVHPETEGEMAWIPSEKGFLMRLTSYVPHLIRAEIEGFVKKGLDLAGLVQDQVAWAFHPGGIQILRKVEEALSLPSEELNASYQILRRFGNMSSCTVLYVLEEMLAAGIERDAVYCCAFGPGLTFESIILHRV